MNVSFGIITSGDILEISNLLTSISKQKLNKVKISEIIVVSTKEDEKHIKKAIKSQKELKKTTKLVIELYRKGKFNAVNLFLKKAKEKILILCSGDVTLHGKAIQELCLPFLYKTTGIVASHPIPIGLDLKKPLDYTVDLLWKVHHLLSLKNPKFGELIAFRNLNFQIPRTAVDEEMIVRTISLCGYKKIYAQNALVYNKGPRNVRDYIRQRKRIYCGHLDLNRKYNYKVITLDNFYILKNIFLSKKVSFKKPFLLLCAIFLEGSSRLLGYIDFLLGKDYAVWDIIEK